MAIIETESREANQLTEVNMATNEVATHSPFGGSIARRIINCPGSVRLVLKVPAELRKPSIFADQGSACHAAMVRLLDGCPFADIVGTEFNGYALTKDDAETLVRPVWEWVDRLLNTPGAVYYVEKRITFPGVAGAFGTCDLIVRIGNTVYVIDYKFGRGVRVRAIYQVGDYDVPNPQLMFYATAARHTVKSIFTGADKIVLTILQPQSAEPDAEMISTATVTHAELDLFAAAFQAACSEALSEAPRLARGPWCKFCSAVPICPVHTRPLLDFANLEAPQPPRDRMFTPIKPADKTAYLQTLAHWLDLQSMVNASYSEVAAQAKRALDNGDEIPGYTLSAGRADRDWCNETVAAATLESLGLARGDIFAEAEMRSPKQIEIRAKARGIKIPKDLIVSSRSGTSLKRIENAHEPVCGRSELARSFTAALAAALEGGGPA
jgi:hypothetical protein